MRYKLKNNPNRYWIDTGLIKVHNYPPNKGTFSYITRTYQQIDEDKIGYVEVDGEPIYFNDMREQERTLAIIMGNAQNALNNSCKRENFLIEDE